MVRTTGLEQGRLGAVGERWGPSRVKWSALDFLIAEQVHKSAALKLHVSVLL